MWSHKWISLSVYQREGWHSFKCFHIDLWKSAQVCLLNGHPGSVARMSQGHLGQHGLGIWGLPAEWTSGKVPGRPLDTLYSLDLGEPRLPGVVLGWRDSHYVSFVSWHVLSVPKNKQWQSCCKLFVEPSGHLTSSGFEQDITIWSIISENERRNYSCDVSVGLSAPLFHNWALLHLHHHTQQRNLLLSTTNVHLHSVCLVNKCN